MHTPSEYQALLESSTVYGYYEITDQLLADYTEACTRLTAAEQKRDEYKCRAEKFYVKHGVGWCGHHGYQVFKAGEDDCPLCLLATAEKERDEFKESYRLAMSSVNHAFDKGRESAEESVRLARRALDEQIAKAEAAEKERDELRAKLERLKECGECFRQNTEAAQEENERLAGEIKCWEDHSNNCMERHVQDQREIIEYQSQLTTAQQSAKEQFVAGMERAAEIADLRCISSGEHSVYEGSVEDAIREAAKEGSK